MQVSERNPPGISVHRRSSDAPLSAGWHHEMRGQGSRSRQRRRSKAHTLATAGRDYRRPPTGAIEPLWLPLALDPSLPMGATTTSNRYLHGLSTGHRRSRSRSRIVDDESVELLGHL